MAWSPEARQAAIEARRAAAQGKSNANRAVKKGLMAGTRQSGARKPGPQTAAHPNVGNRVAFALRNKMAHDAGKDQRVRAAHIEAMKNAISMGTLAKIALGIAGGIGSVVMKGALKGGRGGGRGR